MPKRKAHVAAKYHCRRPFRAQFSEPYDDLNEFWEKGGVGKLGDLLKHLIDSVLRRGRWCLGSSFEAGHLRGIDERQELRSGIDNLVGFVNRQFVAGRSDR